MATLKRSANELVYLDEHPLKPVLIVTEKWKPNRNANDINSMIISDIKTNRLPLKGPLSIKKTLKGQVLLEYTTQRDAEAALRRFSTPNVLFGGSSIVAYLKGDEPKKPNLEKAKKSTDKPEGFEGILDTVQPLKGGTIVPHRDTRVKLPPMPNPTPSATAVDCGTVMEIDAETIPGVMGSHMELHGSPANGQIVQCRFSNNVCESGGWLHSHSAGTENNYGMEPGLNQGMANSSIQTKPLPRLNVGGKTLGDGSDDTGRDARRPSWSESGSSTPRGLFTYENSVEALDNNKFSSIPKAPKSMVQWPGSRTFTRAGEERRRIEEDRARLESRIKATEARVRFLQAEQELALVERGRALERADFRKELESELRGLQQRLFPDSPQSIPIHDQSLGQALGIMFQAGRAYGSLEVYTRMGVVTGNGKRDDLPEIWPGSEEGEIAEKA